MLSHSFGGEPSVPAPDVLPDAYEKKVFDATTEMSTGDYRAKPADIHPATKAPHKFTPGDVQNSIDAQREDTYSRLWRHLILIMNTADRNQKPAGTSGGSGTT
jgi:hypothetical protein